METERPPALHHIPGSLADRQRAFRVAAERVCATFYTEAAIVRRQGLLLDMLAAFEALKGVNAPRIPWARQRIVDGERVLLDRLECE